MPLSNSLCPQFDLPMFLIPPLEPPLPRGQMHIRREKVRGEDVVRVGTCEEVVRAEKPAEPKAQIED